MPWQCWFYMDSRQHTGRCYKDSSMDHFTNGGSSLVVPLHSSLFMTRQISVVCGSAFFVSVGRKGDLVRIKRKAGTQPRHTCLSPTSYWQNSLLTRGCVQIQDILSFITLVSESLKLLDTSRRGKLHQLIFALFRCILDPSLRAWFCRGC